MSRTLTARRLPIALGLAGLALAGVVACGSEDSSAPASVGPSTAVASTVTTSAVPSSVTMPAATPRTTIPEVLCGATPGPAPDTADGPVLDRSKFSYVSSFSQVVPVGRGLAYAVDVTCERFRAAGSVDGGQTWFETLGKLPGGGAANLLFVSPTVGLAYGGQTRTGIVSVSGYSAARTIDGGAHWTVVDRLTGYVLDAAAVGNDVWALTELGDSPGVVSIQRSVDAGATWSPAPAVPASLHPGALGVLLRVGTGSAYALTKGDPRGPADGHLVYTGDGGTTWSDRADPCPSAEREALAAPATADLWSVCSTGFGKPATVVSVYRSSDGGRTWRLVADSGGGALPGDVNVGRLVALDQRNAWVALGAGVFATTDGGATWRLAFAIDDPAPTDVAFVDASDGWALGSGGIWRTADGVTWRRVSQCHPPEC